MKRLVTVVIGLLLIPFILPAQQSLQERLDEFGRIGSTMTLIKPNVKPKRLIDLFFPSSAECRERRASTSTGRLSVRIQNWLI